MINVNKITPQNWLQQYKKPLIAVATLTLLATAAFAISIYFCHETSKYNYWVERSYISESGRLIKYDELVAIDPRCSGAVVGASLSFASIIGIAWMAALYIPKTKEERERNHPSNRSCMGY